MPISFVFRTNFKAYNVISSADTKQPTANTMWPAPPRPLENIIRLQAMTITVMMIDTVIKMM